MRFPLLAALCVLLAPTVAAAQQWQEFSYPKHGFSVHFPAEPRVTDGTFKHSLGEPAPATIYSVRQDDVVYTMTVADFSNAGVEQEAMIADTAKAWGRIGEVKVDVVARINAQYGRELSIAAPDGSRAMVAIFFFNNRLYQLDGRALPPNAELGVPKTMRFQQSLAF